MVSAQATAAASATLVLVLMWLPSLATVLVAGNAPGPPPAGGLSPPAPQLVGAGPPALGPPPRITVVRSRRGRRAGAARAGAGESGHRSGRAHQPSLYGMADGAARDGAEGGAMRPVEADRSTVGPATASLPRVLPVRPTRRVEVRCVPPRTSSGRSRSGRPTPCGRSPSRPRG